MNNLKKTQTLELMADELENLLHNPEHKEMFVFDDYTIIIKQMDYEQ